MPLERIEDLMRQANASWREERNRDAAFLYEQARQLALDRGDEARAFACGRRAARCWYAVGDQVRRISLLLELSSAPPRDVDPKELYHVRVQMLAYRLEYGPLTSARAAKGDADEIYRMLVPDGPDLAHFEGVLLAVQGKFEEAYDMFGIAWSRASDTDFVSEPKWDTAYRAAVTALFLGRVDEARQWIDRIWSDEWEATATLEREYSRLLTALFLRYDKAALAALADLDAAFVALQKGASLPAVTQASVCALTLSERFGDPHESTHPAAMRLNDFTTKSRNSPLDQYSWARAVLAHRLAALRYAAGLPPDEDYYFYRPPRPLPSRVKPRLPRDLSSRIASCREAADIAMSAAQRPDDLFECDWRQRGVAALTERIDRIAEKF